MNFCKFICFFFCFFFCFVPRAVRLELPENCWALRVSSEYFKYFSAPQGIANRMCEKCVCCVWCLWCFWLNFITSNWSIIHRPFTVSCFFWPFANNEHEICKLINPQAERASAMSCKINQRTIKDFKKLFYTIRSYFSRVSLRFSIKNQSVLPGLRLKSVENSEI